ncbi:DNRLRE domain-containing protein [Micromonospora sp. PLK6-60]|uniref:DNRLRE domain-containing protein n=1 Tax=Micromonospora sp. PLK6-60 TaxID=2873383 RepID=UPI001CA70295|nr:DNRLRE domain-containing protein [Micromonospora sp. PLK6-60]MBY8870381.1 DNRLRE domain-containing protein [Micromonospora sp. PLK6-60]
MSDPRFGMSCRRHLVHLGRRLRASAARLPGHRRTRTPRDARPARSRASTVLTVVVALTVLASMVLVGNLYHRLRTAPVAQRPAVPAPTVGELPERNTVTSITRRNADGSYRTAVYSTPVNYRASDGTMRRIDPTLHPVDEDGFAWRSGANAYEARFAGTAGGDLVEFRVGDRRLRMRAEGTATRPAERAGSQITYRRAWPGADLRYEVGPTGVKETIDLAGPDSATSYRFRLTPADDGAPISAHRRPDGSWLVEGAGLSSPPVVLDAPTVLESRGADATRAAKPKLAVAQDGAGLALTLSLDAAWLRAPGRQFPVHLDPTLTVQPAVEDATFLAGTSTAPWTHGKLYIGTDTNTYRGAVQFDLDAVPAGAQVTDAKLGLYFDGSCLLSGCGGVSHLMDAHRITSPWTITTPATSLTYDATALGSYTLAAGAPAGWMSWSVTGAVAGWVGGTQPNYGLLVKRRTETPNSNGPTPPSRRSSNLTAQPKLDVTYNLAAPALRTPTTLHANGAELTWTPADTPSTAGYEVHRGTTAGFTPSPTTLVATVKDPAQTSYRDTTAAAGATFTYKIKDLSSGGVSAGRTVTLPAVGLSSKVLQPGPADGAATTLYTSTRDDGSPGRGCANYGADPTVWVGGVPNTKFLTYPTWRGAVRFDLRDIPPDATISSATLSMWRLYGSMSATTVEAHRASRPWKEGSGAGACTGDGASWDGTEAGQNWTSPGGDFDPAVTAGVAVPATVEGVFDTFAVTGLVQDWVRGTAPNNGVLFKTPNEEVNGKVGYAGDDYAGSASLRPKLTVSYRDGSTANGPTVSVAAPGPAATVRGSAVRLAAAASDDGKVTTVEFLVDGAAVGTATAAPFQLDWNSGAVANGARSVTARATDDAGNVTTSAPVTVTVDNSAPPTGALTAPANGASVGGSAVTLSATATDDRGVVSVAFLVDGVRVGAPDTTAPYAITWNTLDPLAPTFNGSHQVTASVTDTSGLVTVTPAATVTVTNTGATTMKAGFSLNSPTDPTDDVTPTAMTENVASGVPVQDPYAGTTNPDGTSGGSLNRALSGAPRDDGGTPPPSCPANAYCPTVNVTNTSGATWTNSTAQVWYRWYAPNGAILFEGKSATTFPATFAANATRAFPLTIHPPALPPGVQQGTYRLRIDVYDPASATWFSARGNPPLDNPVIVAKALATKLGLERYYQYDGDSLGAGASELVNLANGNLLARWTPFFSPGRGLSTMADLTYNSLEDHSRGPAGNNFSLSLSGLTRLGEPIDIHPNKADEISGRANRWVEFTDGDGTTHHFDGVLGADGVTRWQEPPGVNLHLRSLTGDPNRVWAFTRPDKVTYYFDGDGFPTSVEDRNGNRITYSLEDTPPGEDPGGPKKRITKVTDPGGRSFVIDYWSKDEAKRAHVRGNIRTVTDHSGSKLDFDYYDDGNLLRLTQRGGSNADGSFLADRSLVFTYTTSNGAGPAIPDRAQRVDPEPKTPNQSTRLYSVRDPRGAETTFAYYQASDGAQLRWKLKSRTDRDGQSTSYAYDLTNRITTVTAPLNRVTRYTYDTTGKVTRIVDPTNQATAVQWSTDYKVSQVTEPTGRFTSYTYNANGYPTSRTDQLGKKTVLAYLDQAVDAADTDKHLSLLASVTTPKGVATTADDTDYRTTFSYDAAGNVDRVTDPTGAVTDYDYHLAGSANPGTLSAVRDANGNPPTTYPSYHPSGQPTQVRDPLGNTTTIGYDLDGQVQWLQDPNHAGDSGTDVRAYRSWFDYDSFGRLGRQSAPKSTATDRGTLLWSGATFDPNDNVTREIAPHYGTAAGDPGTGTITTTTFDAMDRATLVTGPDTSADPAGERTRIEYDAAGRTAKVTKPRGVQSSGTVDDFATVYGYDPLDRVVRQVEYGASTSESRVTQMCYDIAGDLRSVTSPRAGSATITCPGDGPANATYTTEYDYDAAHQRVAERDELGHEQRTGYDDNGNVRSVEADITTGRIRRSETEYDQRDQPIVQRERFDGSRVVTTRIEYDRNGNQSRVISPRGADTGGATGPWTQYVTVNTYDAANRLVRTTLPYDSRDGTERQYAHRAYDRNGNLAWTSLPVTQSDATQVATTAKTVMEYFDPGWIRTSDDPANPRTHFDYTAKGQQSQRTPELKASPGTLDTGRRMTWEFHPDGLVKSRSDQNGQPATYRYDADNNLIWSKDVGGVADRNERAIETRSTFNGFDEIARTSHRKEGDSVWKFTEYAYDGNGNTTLRRENGEENDAGTETRAPRRYQLSYDAADWLTEHLDLGTDSACKDDQRVVTTFWGTGEEKQRDTYRAGSSCTADPATWTRKQTTTWTHFDNGKLRQLVTKNGAGTVTESHDVSYLDGNGVYVNGNRTTDRYVLKRGTGSTATSCLSATPCDAAYTYDARDRVLREQLRAGKSNDYTLDEPGKLIGDTTVRAGNVTTQVKDGQTTTQRYTGNQLTDVTVGGVTAKYWYDPYGTQDCVTLAAGSQADCNNSTDTPSANVIADYTPDYLNRITTIQQYSGGTRTDLTTYVYDALDRTTAETEDHVGTGKDRTTTFTYQGLSSQVTEEKQSGGDNPKTKSYSYDAYGHRLGMVDKTNATGAQDTYSYGTDVHGSVSQLLDDAGNVKASYGYSAYGGTDSPSTDKESLTAGDTDAQAPLNPMRYSGRRADSGSAASATAQPQYDMGARRFGPDTGRFLQQDAFASALGDLGLGLDPLTQNRYALAGGNPISYVESDGHMVTADGGGGGAVTASPPKPEAEPSLKDKALSWLGDRGKEIKRKLDDVDNQTVNNPDWALYDVYQGWTKFEEKAEPIVGATEVYKCGTEGGAGNCAWAAAAFVPGGRGAKGLKLAGAAGGAKGLKAAGAGGGKAPLIIGENMTRVKEYAKQVGGHAYRPWKNDPFDFALGMRRNERMIKDAMRSGREIIDIGPDFARRAAGRAASPFYNMERRVTSGYANYSKVFERFGKLDGGVPGFDF